MTNHQYVQVERTLLKRGITDFERKLKAAAASGALGYAIVQILPVLGVHLAPSVAELIPLGIAILGGYSVHSSAVTTTFTSERDDGRTSVRVGPTGTPIGEPKALTGAIPIPQRDAGPYSASASPAASIDPQAARPAPAPEPEPQPEVPDIAPQSFTEVVTSDNATKVYSPGAAFWQARAEARPGFDSPDGN